jgi:hypothetical protein
MKKLKFIKIFFSPFKRPKLKWYFGRVKIGTPYFLPRRWVKPSSKEVKKLALKEFKKWEERRSLYPEIRYKSYDDFYNELKTSQISKPKKIGFDLVGLGYKTKWSNTDYRFEWGPLISFVFFGLQVAVMVTTEYPNHYWESWLYYENDTDKTKSIKERIEQCRKEFSQTYVSSVKGNRIETDYYNLILKQRWVKKVKK